MIAPSIQLTRMAYLRDNWIYTENSVLFGKSIWTQFIFFVSEAKTPNVSRRYEIVVSQNCSYNFIKIIIQMPGVLMGKDL